MKKWGNLLIAVVIGIIIAQPAFAWVQWLTRGMARVGGLSIMGTSFYLDGSQINSTASELNLLHGLNTAGFLTQEATGTITRTDTSTASLFTLPADATPLAMYIDGTAESNAGTAASISVGVSTNQDYFLSTLDVKGSTGLGQQVPAALNLASILTSPATVSGQYTESGTASSAGGPWTVVMLYAI